MLVNAPDYLFAYPAIGAVTAGVVLIALSLVGITLGSVTFGLGTLMSGVVATLVGYQILALALFSSIAGDPIQNTDNRLIENVRHRFQLEQVLLGGIIVAGLGLAWFGHVMGQSDAIETVGSSTIGALLLASTVVVIGLQTVFNSFFLTLIDRQ
nr:hypothetical protein [Halomicroarcula sp. XH51]